MDGSWGSVQNQVIIIMDVALGTYLYKLDGNSFQESYSLEFVSLGITLWRLLVKGQCTIIRTNIRVVSYSKYFTPNTDGYSDKWNLF
jgi:hypothetical protein